MRLTIDLIARCTSGYTKKKRDESIQHYLKRLTHLYLEDRGIEEIGDDLALCKNLTVLYLYDNKLSRIPNLNYNQNLTHLYLQNNHICRIEYLTPLRRLSKLYLGGNSITILEGLDKIDQLLELHIEHQDLPIGEKLLFDPRSLRNILRTLQVLNVSGNNLDSIRDLQCLRELNQFICSDNKLNDMKEMAHLLSAWRHIWRLDLQGNPICHKSKYRDRIIVMSNTLEILDGKEISQTSRQFITNWQASKDERKKRLTDMDFIKKNTEIPDQDHHSPPKLQAMPGYMMPGIPRKQFQEVLARSNTIANSGSEHERLRGETGKFKNTYGTTMNQSVSAKHVRTELHLGTDFSAGDSMNVQPVHLPVGQTYTHS